MKYKNLKNKINSLPLEKHLKEDLLSGLIELKDIFYKDYGENEKISLDFDFQKDNVEKTNIKIITDADFILEHLPCAAMIIRYDDCEIVASNTKAQQLGGIIGTKCHSSILGNHQNCDFCLSHKTKLSDQEQKSEIQFNNKFYSLTWIRLNKNFFVHYIHDITKRKKAEKALEESQANYKMLFDNMNNCFIFGKVNEDESDFQIILANTTFCKYVKKNEEEITGKYFLDIAKVQNLQRHKNICKVDRKSVV